MLTAHVQVAKQQKAYAEKYNLTKRAVELCSAPLPFNPFDNYKVHWAGVANAFSASVAGSEGLADVAERLINVCFVMDCTGSMSVYIDSCQQKVISIADDIMTAVGGNGTVRMSFVGYRDYLPGTGGTQYDPPGCVQVCPFTENIQALKAFVTNQNATGGNDGPEDICGGLQAALSLNWSEGPAASNHMFLIADAPCHGKKYHDHEDSYPDGDPKNLVPEQLVASLINNKGVNFSFMKLNDSTDKMMNVISQYCRSHGGKDVQTLTLADKGNKATEFARVVTHAVISELRMHHK
jgi:hypothetical protein